MWPGFNPALNFFLLHHCHTHVATYTCGKYILKIKSPKCPVFSELFAPIMINVFSVQAHNNRCLSSLVETD